MNTFDFVSKLKDSLYKTGFRCTFAKQGADETVITAYGKDGYEITILVPGSEANKHVSYDGLND